MAADTAYAACVFQFDRDDFSDDFRGWGIGKIHLQIVSELGAWSLAFSALRRSTGPQAERMSRKRPYPRLGKGSVLM